jgi:hypothetical protein
MPPGLKLPPTGYELLVFFEELHFGTIHWRTGHLGGSFGSMVVLDK